MSTREPCACGQQASVYLKVHGVWVGMCMQCRLNRSEK